MLRAMSLRLVSRVLPQVGGPAASCGATAVLGRRHMSTPTPAEESGTEFNKMVEYFALRGSELVIDKIVREEKKMPKEEKRAHLKVAAVGAWYSACPLYVRACRVRACGPHMQCVCACVRPMCAYSCVFTTGASCHSDPPSQFSIHTASIIPISVAYGTKLLLARNSHHIEAPQLV